ncbi:glucose-6-phosphate dehydrogenase assembly protein OpcA [Verrucomicrobiota bacterium sgz303538]
MPLDTSLLGQPVEVGQIPRALKKLWESTGGTKSRASLINFVVYCEGTDALESNTRIISEFTQDHACRAILVANVPDAPEARAQAWINAHCHLPRAGAKQVCCEQITLLIERASSNILANALFANLDSDLPLYLWWQNEFKSPFEESLLTRVDRLIYDSASWKEPSSAFETLRILLNCASTRVVPCDLDWTRSLHLRQAVAQLFDHPENLAQIPYIRRLALEHGSGHRSTALLFAAWIAAQLGWEFSGKDGANLRFKGPGDAEIRVEFKEVDGAPISSCSLESSHSTVIVQREPGSAHHRAEVQMVDGRVYHHLLPAGPDDLCNLLSEELMRGGKHRVYLKALHALTALL